MMVAVDTLSLRANRLKYSIDGIHLSVSNVIGYYYEQ